MIRVDLQLQPQVRWLPWTSPRAEHSEYEQTRFVTKARWRRTATLACTSLFGSSDALFSALGSGAALCDECP